MSCNDRFDDDQLLALSGLQHLVYCKRQWALIHLEGQWAESGLTADGRLLHERTDVTETEVRGNKRIARGLRLRSLQLGLVGRADVVEFRRIQAGDSHQGIILDDAEGFWQPVPVEYKRGKPKPDSRDEVQLCAQALCLEEMLDTPINKGILFYGEPRRRETVELAETLRIQTKDLTKRLHRLMEKGETPPPTDDRGKCRRCSLRKLCLPKAARKKSARNYMNTSINEMIGDE